MPTNIVKDSDTIKVPENNAPVIDDKSIFNVVGDPKRNEMAKKWSDEALCPIFYLPRQWYNPLNRAEIDEIFKEWDGEAIDHRTKAENKSLEIFGYTNKERYDMVCAFLSHRSDRAVAPTVIDPRISVQKEAYNLADQSAISWMTDTNIHLILDKDADNEEDLELSYQKYIGTDYQNRRRADMRAVEIYGDTNENRYRKFKNQISKKMDLHDLHHDDDDDMEDIETDHPIQEAVFFAKINKKDNTKLTKIFNDMKDIEYGYPDKNGQNMRNTDPKSFDDESYFETIYKLLTAKQVEKYKCGVCYDQVEYERAKFEKAGYTFKSYFMGYRRGDKIDPRAPTHTFIVLEIDNKFVWFEHAWGQYQGLRSYDTLEDMLNDVADKFMGRDTSRIRDLFCKDYQTPPQGIGMLDFNNYIMKLNDEAPMREACNVARPGSEDEIHRVGALYKLTDFIDAGPDEKDFSVNARKDRIIKEAISSIDRSIGEYKTTLPYFTPDEMIALGVFSSDKNCYSSYADNAMLSGSRLVPVLTPDGHLNDFRIDDGITCVQWFDNYINMCNGIVSENWSNQWISKLRLLYSDFDQIKESGDIDKINARKQSILHLGWNPEIEFTQENMVKADKRVNALLEFKGKYSHVDLTLTANDRLEDMIDKEIEDRKQIKPVFVILDRGRKIYSPLIAKFTNSEYSHASIGFKDTMNDNYTYLKDGFSNETLRDYGDDRITVYAFFVSTEVADRLKTKIEDFKSNKNKTHYDFSKFVDFVIDKDRENPDQYAQICSTFVDNVLKSADIYIASPRRGIVTPEDINRGLNSSPNVIYKLYDGIATKYDFRKIRAKITRMLRSNTTKVLKESYVGIDEKAILLDFINHHDDRSMELLKENANLLSERNRMIYEAFIAPYVEASVLEVRLFPVQFDKEGNLLIHQTKMKTADFAQHFEESNKLIQSYAKADDIEGIKFELAKLWYMNITIEKMLKTSRNKDFQRQYYIDCRARILNVFYKYIDIVLQKQKNFNFAEYYNNTPFSEASIKINNTTLKYTWATIKNLFKF